MNNQQITCFLTVAETLNFTTAANRLYISQPSITYQIKSLEKELGVTLFHRTTTSTTLTKAGQIFLKDALQLDTLYRQAMEHIQNLQEPSHILIGCPPTLIDFDNDLFASIVKKVMKETHVTMEGRLVSSPSESVQDLIAGRIHLLISARRYALPYQSILRITPMFHCKHYAVLSPSHPLSYKDSLSLHDLTHQNLYEIEEDTCYFPIIREHLQNKGIPVTYHNFQSYAMAIPYVEMGHGIAFSTIQFHRSDHLLFLPLEIEDDIVIALCSLRSNTSHTLTYARQIIQDIFSDYREGIPLSDMPI